MIEFELDGTIITANNNFLNAVGYSLAEIQGQHHSMFVEPFERTSPAYRMFWEKLARGEHDAGEYKRVGKGGKEIWIQATYTPILDAQGKPFKVVKFASDITQEKLRQADFVGQIDAISKSQAVIEFNLDGTIITANDNFLGAVGYHAGVRFRGVTTACLWNLSTVKAPSTVCSGNSLIRASMMPVNIDASAKTVVRSGFRRPTTLSSI